MQHIDARNAASTWPVLLAAIDTCDTLAVDCELSGIGPRGPLNQASVESRYAHLCTVAQSHAIVALGVCTVRAGVAQAFNVSLLCSRSHTVDPAALRFLAQHGFDFNAQVPRIFHPP